MQAICEDLREKLGIAQRDALRLRAKRLKATSAHDIDRLDAEIRVAIQSVWDIESQMDRENATDSDF